MRQQMRSRVANGLDRARLLRPAERIRQSWLTARSAERCRGAWEGPPLPPARLRLLVDGRSGDADRFLDVGRQMFDSIAAAVAATGRSVEELTAVLDFGCGCGRVARHWAGVDGPELHGCDYNRELVAWCEGNLPFLRVARNRLEAPTFHVSRSFDLVYTLSVLSHLDEPLQHAWVAELERLLRPGGLLVISVLGHSLRHRLSPPEASRFDRGELVVQRPRMVGSNVCSAYHPERFVRERLLADFAEVHRFALGSPRQPILQDAYIASRGG